MADSTLSALTAASALDGTELYYTVQGGADRKATGAQIQALVGFSTEAVQDIVGAFTSGTGLTTVTYNDGANTLVIDTPNEAVQDMIATFLAAGSGVTLTYNDVGNTLTLASKVPWLNPIASTWWLPFGLPTGTSTAVPQNIIGLIPFPVPVAMTLSDLGARVVATAAAGNFQLAIYANNPVTNRPTGNALGSTGSLSTTSAANVSQGSLSIPLVVPGLYWWAVNVDVLANNVVTFTSLSATAPWTAPLVGAGSEALLQGGGASLQSFFTTPQTFGTWPDLTGATFTEVAAACRAPIIHMKIASVP